MLLCEKTDGQFATWNFAANFRSMNITDVIQGLCPVAMTLIAFTASFVYPRMGDSSEPLSEDATLAKATRILLQAREVMVGDWPSRNGCDDCTRNSRRASHRHNLGDGL